MLVKEVGVLTVVTNFFRDNFFSDSEKLVFLFYEKKNKFNLVYFFHYQFNNPNNNFLHI